MSDKPVALIIEDNPLDRKLLSALFEHEGFDIDYAEDGQTALRKISSRAAIILVDIFLPALNGFEVAFWMQANTPDLLDRLVIVTNVPREVVTAVLPDVVLVEKSNMVERLRLMAREYRAAAEAFGLQSEEPAEDPT